MYVCTRYFTNTKMTTEEGSSRLPKGVANYKPLTTSNYVRRKFHKNYSSSDALRMLDMLLQSHVIWKLE